MAPPAECLEILVVRQATPRHGDDVAHLQRAQDTLGGLTPIEFEAKKAELLPS